MSAALPPYDELAQVRAGLPKPGSDEALDLGCSCATLDNNHGKYPPAPPNGWWLEPDCPLHGYALPDEALIGIPAS